MATVRQTGDPPPAADPKRWAALGLVLLGVFMDLVDITIVLVAAPAIQEDLGAGHAGIQWVAAAYALGLGLLLITGGRLGDLFGRKRMFLIGVAGFTATSMACGSAQGIGMLIAARAVQDAAAAMMVPQALATIQVAFPADERPKAFGVYGAVNGAAAAAAPIIGGLLVGDDPTAWRRVFWVNVPIGIAAFVGAAALLRESRAEWRPRLDVPGVAIVTVGLLLALYPLVQGAELGRPWWGWAMMAAAVPVFAAFARTQARRERAGGMPLVPASLFRLRSFVAGLVTIVAVFSSISALFLVLTWQLRQGHGFSALRTGLTFLAWPVGLSITSGVAVQYAAKAGRRLVAVGTVLLIGSMSVLVTTIGLADDLSPWHLAPGLLLGGVGFGMVAPILVHIGLSGVPEESAGAASGVANTVVQVSGAAGIAVVGSLFTTFLGHGPDRAAQLSLGFVAVVFLVGLALCRALPKTARSMS